jgi:glycosyltransferase involved in cell wall biosynthesis
MRFAIFTAQYSRTGVPLAQARLARSLVKAGHKVDLIFGHNPTASDVGKLDNVELSIWSCPRALSMLPKIVLYLCQKRPDVVFSAEDNMNAVVLLAAILSRSKAKISVSSRISPEEVYSNQTFSKGWLLKKFVRSVMSRADVWSCVSKDLALKYRKIFPNRDFVCIYNIVDDDAYRSRISEPISHPWLNDGSRNVCITAGTLHKRKGMHYIIEAVSLLQRDAVDVRLIILGSGPQEQHLRTMVQNLGLTERVWFGGLVQNPLAWFHKSDVFILASIREGMPNVLIEAILAGCTPVATNCPTGPREILEDGRYGYLVPMRDPLALKTAIEQALKKPIPPNVLAEALIPFKEETVLAEHFRLLGL